MNYATIKNFDISNGIGIRVSLFVSGCTHHCKGCFNECAWDFNYGEEFTEKTENLLLEYLSSKHIKGLSLLGGEPMELENQKALLPFVRKVKAMFPSKDIWCYSGYTFEQLISQKSILLNSIDVLVDGKFEIETKSIDLKFRGSKNQRIIDVQKSLSTGSVVLYME